MSWADLRQNWQAQQPEQRSVAQRLAEARERDSSLHKKIKRRDRLETVVAVLLIPIFLGAAIFALMGSQWLMAAAAGFIALWCAFVPVRLWWARRQQPDLDADLDAYAYLEQARHATLVQARMLETVMLWYLAPPWVGCVVFYWAAKGTNFDTLGYAVVITAVYGLIYLANRKAARRLRTDNLAQIDADLAALDRLKEHNDD